MSTAKRPNLKLDLSSVKHHPEVLVFPQFVRKGTPFDECVKLEENGSGAFSTVYQVKKRDGTLKAIKVLDDGLDETPKIMKALNFVLDLSKR